MRPPSPHTNNALPRSSRGGAFAYLGDRGFVDRRATRARIRRRARVAFGSCRDQIHASTSAGSPDAPRMAAETPRSAPDVPDSPTACADGGRWRIC